MKSVREEKDPNLSLQMKKSHTPINRERRNRRWSKNRDEESGGEEETERKKKQNGNEGTDHQKEKTQRKGRPNYR